MARLFGIPLELLATGAAAGCALLLGLVLLLTLRRRVLWRLALRNIPRRLGYALLAVAGLALGTAVVSSALFTGDTMTYTVRSLVADSLGRVDEVVVPARIAPNAQNRRWFEALTTGAPLTAGSSYFDAQRYEELAAALPADSPIAALVPAIVGQGTLIDLSTQQLALNVTVLGLPADLPSVLGRLVRPDGSPLALTELAAGTLYVNTEAASQLSAAEGDQLELRLDDHVLPLRLAATYAAGDLGGTRPTVVLPLAHLQDLLGRPGQINQILVVNRGDRTDSVTRSTEAATALRAVLVDDAAAARALAVLRRDHVQQALRWLVPNLRPDERPRFERLLGALDGAAEEHARALVRDFLGDPEAATRLALLAARLSRGDDRSELFGALNAAGGLRVLELKRVVQERADTFASILSSIFVVLGIFSIATGLMLVFLVFMLLAAGRRGELAITRALGAYQRDLVALLLIEGLAYAVAAAAVGVAAGLAITFGLVHTLQGALEPLGFTVRAHAAPHSVALAFFAGLLLALLTIGLAAWWTSRLNIAAAIRNEAEPEARLAVWLGPLLALGLALLGAGLLVSGATANWLLPLVAGLSALVLAAERLLTGLLRVVAAHSTQGGAASRGSGLVTALAAIVLVILWWEPRAVIAALHLGRPPLSAEYFPAAGVAMVLAATWGLATNLHLLLWLLGQGLRPLRGGAALASRLAAAYLAQQRGRAGLTIAMFGLVLCSLTVSAVLLAGAHQAYGHPDAENGGYDLRLQGTDEAGTLDLRAALATARAVRPDDFEAIGGQRSQNGELIRLGGERARWHPASVHVLDTEFLQTTAAHLSGRAPGYDSEAAVWRALAEQPGAAVIGTQLAAALEVAPAQLGSTVVWVRARGGGPAIRVVVIGVLGASSPLGDGVFIGEATAAGLPTGQQVTYFLRTRDGLAPERAASALNLSFGERGLRASLVDPELRLSRAVQAPLSYLLRGFMGLGLVSGVLAVGLLGARAVLERRAQIGMLRAVGMRARTVQFLLLLEGSVLALAGSAVGVGMGVVLAGQVVRQLQRQHPELPLQVPVDQLLVMAALAWGAALLAAAIPAWRAGRISPVEALRCD
ncbi:MAG: FtsX-like permease family protein [Chloroflexi bacterium]|nr:FtsX-like permease family protein [Chloroflexota bacterium]